MWHQHLPDRADSQCRGPSTNRHAVFKDKHSRLEEAKWSEKEGEREAGDAEARKMGWAQGGKHPPI